MENALKGGNCSCSHGRCLERKNQTAGKEKQAKRQKEKKEGIGWGVRPKRVKSRIWPEV